MISKRNDVSNGTYYIIQVLSKTVSRSLDYLIGCGDETLEEMFRESEGTSELFLICDKFFNASNARCEKDAITLENWPEFEKVKYHTTTSHFSN